MATATCEGKVYSVPDLADLWGVPRQAIRLAIGKLKLGRRVGRAFIVAPEDLPHIETVLRYRGIMPPAGASK